MGCDASLLRHRLTMEIVLEALEERVDCGLGVAEGGGQMEDGGWWIEDGD